MTLLVSQVEFLGSKIEYPFIHKFHARLPAISDAMAVLENSGVEFQDNYTVIDGVAKGALTITFTRTEQVIAFLHFEHSSLIEEVLEKTGLLAISGGTFLNGNPSNPISRIRDSYERVIRTLNVNLTIVMHSAVNSKSPVMQVLTPWKQ